MNLLFSLGKSPDFDVTNTGLKRITFKFGIARGVTAASYFGVAIRTGKAASERSTSPIPGQRPRALPIRLTQPLETILFRA